jgi:hypothetical protein
MKELRSYHCNNCGALLFVGEQHTCDSERVAMIDRIAQFLSKPSDLHPEDNLEKRFDPDWPDSLDWNTKEND